MKVVFLNARFDVFFLFWNVKNVKIDLMVKVKMAILSAKCVLKKRIDTSIKDLSIALNYHS